MWFPNRSDADQAVQSQKMARGLTCQEKSTLRSADSWFEFSVIDRGNVFNLVLVNRSCNSVIFNVVVGILFLM